MIGQQLVPTQYSNLIFKQQYAVSSNGRFAIVNRQEQEVAPITVILNWKP